MPRDTTEFTEYDLEDADDVLALALVIGREWSREFVTPVLRNIPQEHRAVFCVAVLGPVLGGMAAQLGSPEKMEAVLAAIKLVSGKATDLINARENGRH